MKCSIVVTYSVFDALSLCCRRLWPDCRSSVRLFV